VWSVADYSVMDSQRAWLMGSRIVIEDQRSRLRSIDLQDGTVSEPYELPVRGEWDPLELRSVRAAGTQLIAQYPQRIVMYNPASGSITGADVITDDRDYRFLIPAKDKFIVVNSRAMQLGLAEQPGRRSQRWSYRLYVLSDNCKVLEDPLELMKPLDERVQFATALDNWLLLSTQSGTLAVPMPAK
jgi:hypothetical protein